MNELDYYFLSAMCKHLALPVILAVIAAWMFTEREYPSATVAFLLACFLFAISMQAMSNIIFAYEFLVNQQIAFGVR